MPLFLNTKLLKIALPVTTLTAATIITATLLFSNREDLKLTSLNDEALQNYDKELNPYEEELMKQEAEQEEEKSKDEKGSESEVKDAPKKQKTLEELFEAKIEGADGKESLKKLLSDPKQLVEDLLKGEGIKPPSEGEKNAILQKAEEISKGIEKNKQESQELAEGSPQERQDEEALGEPFSNQKEKPTLSEKESVEEDRSKPDVDKGENEASLDQPTSDDGEENHEVEQTLPTESDPFREEIIEEGPPEEQTTGYQETDNQPKVDTEDTLIREKDDSVSQEDAVNERESEIEPKGGPEATEGGSDESAGGDSEETKYNMDTLTSLEEKLSGAIFSLRPKLG